MEKIFEQIPTFEETKKINFKKNKEVIENITRKLIELIIKYNRYEIEINHEITKDEIDFINSEVGKIIIENFAKKGWEIEIKNNNDEGQGRIWNSLKIKNIN